MGFPPPLFEFALGKRQHGLVAEGPNMRVSLEEGRRKKEGFRDLDVLFAKFMSRKKNATILVLARIFGRPTYWL